MGGPRKTNTGEERISKVGNRFVVNLIGVEGAKLQRPTAGTLDEAIIIRDEALEQADGHIVKGDFEFDLPQDPTNMQDLISSVIKVSDQNIAAKQEWHNIYYNSDKPFGLVALGDAHVGGGYVNYRALFRDAWLIRQTPGLVVGTLGDILDNWVSLRLVGIQKYQIMPHKQEIRVGLHLVKEIKDSLLWLIEGNHELRTEILTGIDIFRDVVPAQVSTKFIHDQHELGLRLHAFGQEWKILARHKWKGNSVFNVTHSIEVAYQRYKNFDIGMGGHIHAGTYLRPFPARGNEGVKYALLIGTYKAFDDYARDKQFKPPTSTGSAVMVFDVDGSIQCFSSVPQAALYVNYLRGDKPDYELPPYLRDDDPSLLVVRRTLSG